MNNQRTNMTKQGATMTNQNPNFKRCTLMLLVSLACAGLLIELNGSTPWPPSSPSQFSDWWERYGTANAAITLLRMAGIAIAGWGIFIGSAGLLAAIRPSGLLRAVWQRITPTSFQRFLAVGAISVSLAVPAVASASNPGIETRVVMTDLGQHIEQSAQRPVLSDLGPAPIETSSEASASKAELQRSDATTSTTAQQEAEPSTPANAQEWIVTEGDHLWKIAMNTLRAHGHETEPAAVVGYWQRLISANSEILNGNPDLIYPGMVLNLPPVQP